MRARIYVCACVSVCVTAARQLHDGHNISDYRIDAANAASTFSGGRETEATATSVLQLRLEFGGCGKIDRKKKIAAIHNAKGSSAGCVQISFGKSQHAHNELYCVFLIGISAPRRGHDEPPRVSYCRKSERD